jgi:hypothetical protein
MERVNPGASTRGLVPHLLILFYLTLISALHFS